MKRSLCIIVHLVLVLFFCSCGKSTCLNPGLRVTFNGYDSSELSGVLIEQYVSNSNFSTLVSVSFYDTSNIQIRQSSDTVYMPMIDTSGAYIAPGYDYIIAIPAVKTGFFADSLFKITKISYNQVNRKSSSSGTGGCTNDVTYYLDNIPHKVTGGSFTETNLLPVN
ncbi:MAG: hypothetical protein ACHQD8_06880, partial [Chitinophagales bacterium]